MTPDENREERLADKPRGVGETARWYGVDRRTLRGWLQRVGLHDLADWRSRRLFTVKELERISEAIGE